MNTDTFNDHIRELNHITLIIESVVSPLTERQLNWKPALGVWSIGECLQHVMVTNQAYFPQFAAIAGASKITPTWWQRTPWLPQLWGRMMIRMLDPQSTSKLKAPKLFQPTQAVFERKLIAQFTAHQKELSTWIESCKTIIDQERSRGREPVISSPVTALITLKLGDCFNLLIIHEQRHLEQIKRLMSLPTFPS